jgi:membrane protein implicated in regulation of membrane protease activity
MGGGIAPGVGIPGGLAALVCIVLGIVILLGGRWLAGAFLLAAALIAMLAVGPWLGAVAAIGGVLSILHGHRGLRPGELEDRLEEDRQRLQQRYGASR